MLRLKWDWDSAEDRHHHCDSACFEMKPEPGCTPGSVGRDEGKICAKEQRITVLPRA